MVISGSDGQHSRYIGRVSYLSIRIDAPLGPFQADLMQKWHDDGYFTGDLRMKRTRIDNDWITVAELLERVGHNRIFLVPIPPPSAAPPGLMRRVETPTEAPTQPGNSGSPYQPIPTRSMRGSTLDSFLGNTSNPSDSPASSYGVARFGNGTPDGTGFGGRAAAGYHTPGEPIVGPRLATITSAGDPLRGVIPFANASPARANNLDSYHSTGTNTSTKDGLLLMS